VGFYTLPADINKTTLLGAGLLAGIGFTMSIFITLLAFPAGDLVLNSKIVVLAASVLAGLLGYAVLTVGLPKTQLQEE
jgi:NhaA family Na+:H+ antiporter